jgi:hypothetical protein
MLATVPPVHQRSDRPPARVVSLLPSATEILYAIGAGDDVVAVTHECDFPPEAATRPAVTASALNHDGSTCAAIDRHIKSALHAGSSIYRLDEKLLAPLEPSLIVTQELCDVCAVSYDQVSEAVRRMSVDIPVLSLEPSSLADILNSILAVGAATDRENAAANVVRSLRERIAAVDAQPAMNATPRVVCIEWTDPLMVAGHRASSIRDQQGWVGASPPTWLAVQVPVAASVWSTSLLVAPCPSTTNTDSLSDWYPGETGGTARRNAAPEGSTSRPPGGEAGRPDRSVGRQVEHGDGRGSIRRVARRTRSQHRGPVP